MLLLHDLTLGNNGSLSAHHISNLLSILNSSEHGISFNLLFELLEVSSLNIVSLLVLLKNFFHLMSFFNLFLIHGGISGLLGSEFLDNIDVLELNVVSHTILFNELIIFLLGFCFPSVGTKGESDKDKEE